MPLRIALVALALVATSLVALPAAASATPVAPAPTARSVDAAPAGSDSAASQPNTTGEAARRIPSIATIRACLRTIGTAGTCLAEGLMQTCGGSFTALWKCASKAYGAYRAAQRIMDLRADSRCPRSLGGLAPYLCSSRVTPASPVVWLTVSAQTRRLNAFTGPGTWFTLTGSYADGAQVGVVCVTANGQRITDPQIMRSSTYWARLANGSFISWIYLTSRIPTSVRFC